MQESKSSGNEIYDIEVLGQLSNLEDLHLNDNNIVEIPESLTNLKNLKNLYLRHNPLSVEKSAIEGMVPNTFVVI